ncbi:hypothetical protein CAPTEDRAFT_202256 [Capitella teleta]|uniref:GATA-type domain-containing protein n=1 Tax=Capitella teleta TaxID=283909 RepID=R7V1U9_CAPTE|nr:hypothetical protein CAPTEDRAFT_202256 [Capitella teleta]|eukprot:ELU09646.1 hypothetical protein CAPTEDRAFT_202256 [Capitella teleta]
MNNNLSSSERDVLDDLASLMSKKMTTHITDELQKLSTRNVTSESRRPRETCPFSTAHQNARLGPVSPVYASPFPIPSAQDPLTPEQSAKTAPNVIESESETPSLGATKRRSRKQDRPRKSASRWDPAFRGVTLHFQTIFKHGKPDFRINAVYQLYSDFTFGPFCIENVKWKSGNVIRQHRTDSRSRRLEELTPKSPRNFVPRPSMHASGSSGKQCASCGTKKTPLWRDAEDGTPLCNACGIRYKKYRLRCTNCWHIPKKDSKVQSHCCHCGHLLKLAVFKYKVW